MVSKSPLRGLSVGRMPQLRGVIAKNQLKSCLSNAKKCPGRDLNPRRRLSPKKSRGLHDIGGVCSLTGLHHRGTSRLWAQHCKKFLEKRARRDLNPGFAACSPKDSRLLPCPTWPRAHVNLVDRVYDSYPLFSTDNTHKSTKDI